MKSRFFILFTLILSSLFLNSCAAPESPEPFVSEFSKETNRTWIGPEYWANRLQEWALENGQIRCLQDKESKPIRTLHLLTRKLNRSEKSFEISVITGPIADNGKISPDSLSGFLIGAGGHLDYRAASLIHHAPGSSGGIIAGINGHGEAIFRSMEEKGYPILARANDTLISGDKKHQLVLKGFQREDGYHLELEVNGTYEGPPFSKAEYIIKDPKELFGNIALVSHPGKGENTARYWFEKWTLSGQKIDSFSDHICGPVISTQHTLSNNILKLTAQLMPLGNNDSQTATLEIKNEAGWKIVAEKKIIIPGFTATFRITDWDSAKAHQFRVAYQLDESTRYWGGTILPDPVDKETITVAAFTGNHNTRFPKPWVGVDSDYFPWDNGVWFPHSELSEHVMLQTPDLLFFSGDQVYEGSSPTRAEFKDNPDLDYLYKWYLWCWAFRDMTRNIPAVVIPDDHDVYQGNIWGAGGRKTDRDNKGGYMMPAEWVKMVERTQTSHLPDPFDPEPIDQGIGVYYSALNYGRISFAIIEDRKFKSGPDGITPPTTSGRPDHIINPDFDPATADVPGATLLGKRQLDFLETWAADWKYSDMKVALSQTVFANAASIHGPEHKRLVADYDSNGWPQTGRNNALRKLRKGFATHISGDQHLATIIHYGIDDFDDAGWSLCVPSIANFYPRTWAPLAKPINHQEGMPDYTGSFFDGFNNRITVWAAANPGFKSGQEPAELHDRVPGYGIARFYKETGEVTFECWPRYVNPRKPESGTQYPGWPKTINMLDNYGKKALGYLPKIKVSGIDNPVIQVIKSAPGEIVYTLRIRGNTFKPKIFEDVFYTLKIGEPDEDKFKVLEGLRIDKAGEIIELTF